MVPWILLKLIRPHKSHVFVMRLLSTVNQWIFKIRMNGKSNKHVYRDLRATEKKTIGLKNHFLAVIQVLHYLCWLSYVTQTDCCFSNPLVSVQINLSVSCFTCILQHAVSNQVNAIVWRSSNADKLETSDNFGSR